MKSESQRKSKLINFRAKKSFFERLFLRCKVDKETMSNFIRVAIEKELLRREG